MARYDLGLVKGPKGDKGDQGAVGPVGPQGVQGPPARVCGKEPDAAGNIILGTADVDGLSAALADKAGLTHTHTLLEAGGSGRNLLENWYFQSLVNQSGKTEYTVTGAQYFIDCWRSHASGNAGDTYRLTKDGLTYRRNGGNTWAFIQVIENPQNYSGLTLTASFLFHGCTAPVGLGSELIINCIHGGVENSYHSGPAKAESGVMTVTITLPEDVTRLWIVFTMYTQGAEITYEAAKLELGSVQTLARQENGAWVLNDPPPNPAVELAKCQRYYYEINNLGVGYPYAGLLTAYSATHALGVIEVPVSMRARPTLICSGEWRLLDLVGSVRNIITSVGVGAAEANGCASKMCVDAVSTGLTPGKVYLLSGNGKSKGVPKLAFDANL